MPIALFFFPLTRILHLTGHIKEYVNHPFIHQMFIMSPLNAQHFNWGLNYQQISDNPCQKPTV